MQSHCIKILFRFMLFLQEIQPSYMDLKFSFYLRNWLLQFVPSYQFYSLYYLKFKFLPLLFLFFFRCEGWLCRRPPSPLACYTTSSAADIYDGDGGGVTAARKPSIDFVALFFLSLLSPLFQQQCLFFPPFFPVIVWTPFWCMCNSGGPRRRSQIRIRSADATDVPRRPPCGAN